MLNIWIVEYVCKQNQWEKIYRFHTWFVLWCGLCTSSKRDTIKLHIHWMCFPFRLRCGIQPTHTHTYVSYCIDGWMYDCCCCRQAANTMNMKIRSDIAMHKHCIENETLSPLHCARFEGMPIFIFELCRNKFLLR